MLILFYPPLGEAIHVAVPVFTPHTRTAPLLFTAELDPADYNELISEGAQVQIWSDIPYEGRTSDTGWGELAFETAVQLREARAISSVLDAATDKITLFARTLVPIPDNGSQSCFSFTYRIVYPSANIQWLGTFGLNGSVTLSREDPSASPGLVLSQRWQSASSGARTYSLDPDTHSEVVGKISRPEDYHVWALGLRSFLVDGTNGSLFFLIPKRQTRSLNHSPTYVLAASPQASLSILANGEIATSGSGSLTFQADDLNVEPDKFIHDLLTYSQMDLWKILGHDTKTRTIYLASPAENLPVQLLLIPLGLWTPGSSPLDLDLHALTKLFGESDTLAEEIAVYCPRKKGIHLFNVDGETQKPDPKLLFQLDQSGINLIISPVYSLQARDNSASWKTIFLTPYSVPPPLLLSDEPAILPTTPPLIHPISRLSQPPYALAGSEISSVPSLSSDLGLSSHSPVPFPGLGSSPSLGASGRLQTHDDGILTIAGPPKPYSPHQIILTAFKLLISSAIMILGFLCRLLYGGWPGSAVNPKDVKIPESTESPWLDTNKIVEPNHDVLQVDLPDRLVDEPSISLILDESTNPKLQAQGRILPDGILYAAFYPGWGNTTQRRSIAAIVILKGDLFNVATEVVDDAISTPAMREDVEQISSAVKFLDEGDSECTARECLIVQHDLSGRDFHSKTAFCLLEYNLVWENEQKERTVKISPPIIHNL